MKTTIQTLLSAYTVGSAKRIAKAKKIHDRELQEEKRRENFRSAFKNKVAQEIRPFMNKLLKSIGTCFTCETDSQLDRLLIEQYTAKSKSEEADFYISLMLETEDAQFEEKVILCMGWSVSANTEHLENKKYGLHEITPALMEKTFISMLENMSK